MGKSKAKKAKEFTPDPDTVFLYIENPVGIRGAKDWYKNPHALRVVSAWLYILAEAGGLSYPTALHYRGGVSPVYLRDIVVEMSVPSADPARVEYALGVHTWREFVRLPPDLERDLMLPREEESRRSVVYRSPCRSSAKLESDQFITVSLTPMRQVDFRDFRPPPYPPPTLPLVTTPQTTYKEPLPARPAPAPSPSVDEELKKSNVEQKDVKDQRPAIYVDGASERDRSTLPKQEEPLTLAKKEEQLDSEFEVVMQARRSPSQTPQLVDTKPNMNIPIAKKEEELEHEVTHTLRHNPHLSTPAPPSTQADIKPNITALQDVKPTITAPKDEQLVSEFGQIFQGNPRLATPEIKPDVSAKEEELAQEMAGLTAEPPLEVKPDVSAKEEEVAREMPGLMAWEPRVKSEDAGGPMGVPPQRKEEQLELEFPHLPKRSPPPSPRLSVKPELGRGTPSSTVAASADLTADEIKSESGSATPNPLKRGREGRVKTDEFVEKRLKREWY